MKTLLWTALIAGIVLLLPWTINETIKLNYISVVVSQNTCGDNPACMLVIINGGR